MRLLRASRSSSPASSRFIAMAIALFLAVQANRRIRGARFYKTMLIWPYAVATMVAGVLWLFMFNPNVGVRRLLLKHRFGIEWNHLLNDQPGLHPHHPGRILEADRLQLRLLPRRPAERAGHAWSRPRRSTGPVRPGASGRIVFPLLSPTTFYLLVMNLVYGFFETFPIIHQVTSGRTRQGDEPSSSTRSGGTGSSTWTWAARPPSPSS